MCIILSPSLSVILWVLGAVCPIWDISDVQLPWYAGNTMSSFSHDLFLQSCNGIQIITTLNFT